MKKTNCVVHGKPMYRVRAKIGEDLNGDPVVKSFYGDGKVEAERRRDEYLAKHENVKEDRTFGQLAKYYTYQIMPGESLAVSTIELYERPYRKYIEGSTLSVRSISNIKPMDIQKFLDSLSISKGTMVALTKYLRRFFRWCYKEGYSQNVMSGVTTQNPFKRTKTDDISVFNDEEVQSIIRTPNRLHFAFLLALSTGLREGEILGLKYSDFKDGAVNISRQVHLIYEIDSDGYREPVTRVDPPKTESSVRAVPLPDNVQEAFLEHKRKHEAEMKTNGYRTEYVFTTDTGNWIDRGNFRTAWIRHLKRAGVPYKKFHSCRATYCTLLCKRGVPLETASKLMGHSDISTTASFYRMVSTGEMISAADRLNDLFQKPSGDKVAT